MRDRLAPRLQQFADARTVIDAEGLDGVRAGIDARRRAEVAEMAVAGLTVSDTAVPGGDREIAVRIYRPAGPVASALFCHSGAFVLGNLDIDHRLCVELARRARVAIVSVDYRLAPEHSYPAALTDALGALAWIADAMPGPVGVIGSSAGGCLAATVAQRSADGHAPALAFQVLHQPVLDDRPSPAKEEFTATLGFDGPAAVQMWRYYLGAHQPDAASVPGRREGLAGLAPAFVSCAELDPLRDEALDYAIRLTWAQVPTELHLFPGACHGFDALAPDWELSQTLFELAAAFIGRQVG
ncbi:MAG: alpha/beta hydrolase [Mycolicibacterium insubricum]|nr:alpha/beta hydrolase [Mycobacterium sp.]